MLPQMAGSPGRGAAPALPLADLLSLLQPAPPDTTLLRACLLTDDRGKAAFRSWSNNGSSADLLPPRWNCLFPLLAEAMHRFALPIEPGVRSRLRAALLSEEARCQAYVAIAGPALTALAEGGIEVIVLKGAALAATVYPRPQLRHTHDVDLLVEQAQRGDARACLQRRGWRLTRSTSASATDTLTHASGLPLCLHTRLIRGSLLPENFNAFRDRAQPCAIAGNAALTLSPADTLLHVLGQAVTSGSTSSLRWACDAFFCVTRGPEVDWKVFNEELTKTQLAIAYDGLLHYLRDNLGLTFPTPVVAEIDRQATQATWWQREALVASLDAGAFGRRRMWARAQSWPARLALLKWLLAPDSRLAQVIAPGVPRWRLPLDNLRQVIGGVRSQPVVRADWC
jgi:hypothetical protein